jgi:hypothetical protein
MYRPLLANKVTLTELNSIVTVGELFEINALLDMQEDIKYQMHKEQEANNKRGSR